MNFASNMVVRDQSCTVHAKMLFKLTWNVGFKCSCFDVFIKSCCRRSFRGIGEPVPPASRVLRDDLAVRTDLDPGVFAEVLCAFLHSEEPNDGPNVTAPQDLMVLLQERCRSFRFLSKLRVQHGLIRSFPENCQLVLHLLEQTVYQVVGS